MCWIFYYCIHTYKYVYFKSRTFFHIIRIEPSGRPIIIQIILLSLGLGHICLGIRPIKNKKNKKNTQKVKDARESNLGN